MDELEEIVFKHALLNAAKHKGSANPGAVMGSIMSSEPELRPRAKEIGPLSGKIVAQVNALSPEEQKAKMEELGVAVEEKKQKHCILDMQGQLFQMGNMLKNVAESSY